ncbi:unnamed protein product [Paramecium sonneborni]|uniref:Uncharacterized protein n=1 Tax=Paramecium sonneborni TaxID=65129 RepID=A0A8S1PJ72_9CILI|nr:unnamed protein product [Paramecium sonneborni]
MEILHYAFDDEQLLCKFDTKFVILFQNLLKKSQTQSNILQYIKIQQLDNYQLQKYFNQNKCYL